MRYDIKTEDDVLDALEAMVEEIEEIQKLISELYEIGFDLKWPNLIIEGRIRETVDFEKAQKMFDKVNREIHEHAKVIMAIRIDLNRALKGNSLLTRKLDPNDPLYNEAIEYEVGRYTDTVNKRANVANAAVSGYEGTFITIADAGREVDNAIAEYNSVIDTMNEGLRSPLYEKAKLIYLEDTARAVVERNKTRENHLRQKNR